MGLNGAGIGRVNSELLLSIKLLAALFYYRVPVLRSVIALPVLRSTSI